MAKRNEYLTLDEIAETLKCTRKNLYNYIKAGRLKAVKIGRYYVKTEDFLDFMLQDETDEGLDAVIKLEPDQPADETFKERIRKGEEKEFKTRRVQLVMKPSLYAEIVRIAELHKDVKGKPLPINKTIETMLEYAVDKYRTE